MPSMKDFGTPDNRSNTYAVRDLLTMKYPVIWNANKDGVICFPNMPLHKLNLQNDLRRENPWFPKHSSDTHNVILSDLADPNKSQTWLPVSRGVKRLGKRTEQSLSRVVSRAFLWRGDKIDCPQYIDNIASYLTEMHKPADFKFASDVEDMRNMYTRDNNATPTSCMDSRHSFQLSKPDRPIDFYGYCPIIKGAYLSRSGVILARTICWLNPTDGSWYHSRIYHGRIAEMKDMQKHLDKYGVKPFTSANNCKDFTCEFDIPASNYGDQLACPMPYFDNMPAESLVVKLSNDETMFHVRMGICKEIAPKGEDWQHPSVSSTSGSYMAYKTENCTNCDTSIDTEDSQFWSIEGDVFCSVSCAESHDATWYVTSNDTHLVYEGAIDNGSGNIRAYYGNAWFSCEHAAQVRGCVYHPVPWADTEVNMFIYFDDNSGDDFSLRSIGAGGYNWTSKNKSTVRMYSNRHTDVTKVPCTLAGDFTFYNMPVVSVTSSKQQVDDTATVITYNGVIASCDNIHHFDDSDFDHYLGDVLKPHAPTLPGVTILQPLDLF